MTATIPYARQSISQDDIDAVVGVLRSDWVTQGPAIARFEQGVASYCGVRHAIAVSNGTAALHLSCLALGLGRGDALWTSPNTFVASANCARYCGADVDFVDIDPLSGNMSVDALAEKLERAARAGKLPKIVVPVHFGGQSCDMQPIGALAARYGFRVLEDASHALGAEYRTAKVGSCAYADLTVLSFHAIKIITSGEGGMLLTNNDDLARRVRRLRTHGITRESAEMQGDSDGPWYYQQIELGYNDRMTDVQAALGESQLRRIDAFLVRRRRLAKRYALALENLPVRPPREEPYGRSAWHLYAIQLEPRASAVSRRTVYERMRAAGILVNVHYIPVHLQPYYRALGYQEGDFPAAEGFYARELSLPMYYGLSDADQDRVCASLRESLR